MLIGRQAERAFVDLRNFTKASLVIPTRFILYTSVFNEKCTMVPAVLACGPAVVVYVPIEGVWSSRGKWITKAFLDIRFESVQTHPVDGVLHTSILTAVKRK